MFDYLYSESLSKRNGYLFCENVKVKDIQASLEDKLTQPSPLFVYSKSQLEQNVSNYKRAFEEHKIPHLLGYSIKANFSPHILQMFRSLGCTAVAVSGLELKLAIDSGFHPPNLVLNGNGKSKQAISLAVDHQCLLNVDSAFDLENIIQIAREKSKCARVLLRLNPDIDSDVHPYLATGLGKSKFGIEESQLPNILNRIKTCDFVNLCGLHCHLGSTISRVEIFSESLTVMLKLTKNVISQGFNHVKYINLGGGLGINYTAHMPTPHDLIKAIENQLHDSGLTLILEPGRSLVGNAATLVTTVLGTKQNGSTRYVVVDGSMAEAIRPSFYGAYHHIELTEPQEGQSCVYDVVGPVCECGDFLGKARYLPEPQPGCGLALFDAGAYCGTMASNYNLRMRPAEVLVDKDNWKLIRKPDELDDILKPYR